MMKVVSFVTQKGGSGKTTLAISCAVAAEQTGKRVIICDLDPQRTAESWYQDREADTPKLVSLASAQLEAAISAATDQGFDLVLIDTPGRDEPAVAAAIRLSDFCIIPCRPTPADMKATPETVRTVNRLERPAAFVLTQTPPRSFRIGEAERGLSMLGMVAPIHIVMRNAYQDAQGAGQGVTEYEPDGKAAQEIRDLWTWINKKMEKIAYDPTETEKTHVA
jgi:chromosome partitioning protein